MTQAHVGRLIVAVVHLIATGKQLIRYFENFEDCVQVLFKGDQRLLETEDPGKFFDVTDQILES